MQEDPGREQVEWGYRVVRLIGVIEDVLIWFIYSWIWYSRGLAHKPLTQRLITQCCWCQLLPSLCAHINGKINSLMNLVPLLRCSDVVVHHLLHRRFAPFDSSDTSYPGCPACVFKRTWFSVPASNIDLGGDVDQDNLHVNTPYSFKSCCMR